MILYDKETKENRYYIIDVEIGLYEVDKIEYERYIELRERINNLCPPKIKDKGYLINTVSNQKGVMMFFGTSGDSKSNKEFKDLFCDPIIYKVVDNEWDDKPTIERFYPTYKPSDDGN